MDCGDLNEKEVQEGGGVCTGMVDPFCCTVKTNTTLQSFSVRGKGNLGQVLQIPSSPFRFRERK